MQSEYIINGVVWIRKEEPKDEKRLVRWVFNDISSPVKFSEGCTKLVEIRDNERILSRDDIRSAWIGSMELNRVLKALGFDK
jgi:hypothetical protein